MFCELCKSFHCSHNVETVEALPAETKATFKELTDAVNTFGSTAYQAAIRKGVPKKFAESLLPRGGVIVYE